MMHFLYFNSTLKELEGKKCMFMQNSNFHKCNIQLFKNLFKIKCIIILYYTVPKNYSRAYDLILICPKRFAWNSQRATRKVRGQLTSHRKKWKRQKVCRRCWLTLKSFSYGYDFFPHLLRSATSIA